MQIPGLRIDSGLEGLAWQPTRYEGVEWIDLAPEDNSATMTVLIRMAPGRGYPAHRHLGPEDVLVLRGGYRDGDGRLAETGAFLRYPPGSVHAPVALGELDEPESDGNPACVLFAVAHGGTELAETTKGGGA